MRSHVIQLPPQIVTAFEMQRKPAAFQRRALQEPITVTSNGEPTLIVMSVAEYQRLRDQAEGCTLPPDQIEQPAYPRVMRRTEAVSRLKDHRDDLLRLGITHVALFGSVARDQADELSDVDIIVAEGPSNSPFCCDLAARTRTHEATQEARRAGHD